MCVYFCVCVCACVCVCLCVCNCGRFFFHKSFFSMNSEFTAKTPPENFLLLQVKPMTVKLCDYGISTSQPSCYKTPGMLRSTPGYGAPEVVQQVSCGIKADMWSLGVCLFFLLTKHQPFIGSSPQETVNRMSAGQYDAKALARFSPQAADLVSRLLTVDAGRRISAAEAMNHPWIKMGPQDLEELVSAPQAGVCCMFGDAYQGRAFKNPSRNV